MLRSVLIPTDFSLESDLLLRFAQGLDACGVERVVLGHIVEASGMEGPIIAKHVDKVRDRIQAKVHGLRDQGLRVEIRIGTGEPSSGLLALAAESHVDGVVCGTHGKGAITKFFSGSVSEDLLRGSFTPMMLVRFPLLRNAEDASGVAKRFGQKLVLPTDFSSASMRALMAALELPSKNIGTLYFLHVLDASLTGDKKRKAEDGAEFQMKNWIAMAAEQGITARAVIRQGDPRQEALREMDERRATGVIVGNRGRNALQEAMLGSVSMTLLRQASCPVLVVP